MMKIIISKQFCSPFGNRPVHDPNEIVSMFGRSDEPAFNGRIESFLESVVGPRGMRTSMSVKQVEQAASLTSQIQALTANLDRYRV